jgi:hypothetical protein
MGQLESLRELDIAQPTKKKKKKKDLSLGCFYWIEFLQILGYTNFEEN